VLFLVAVVLLFAFRGSWDNSSGYSY
jgi:hypothetical protein